VEIGVFEGVTTTHLRQAMAPDGELTAVDPHLCGRLGFSTHRVIARAEVERVPNGNVRWIRSFGVEAAGKYRAAGGAPVDFMFLDGDNSYHGLSALWDAWSPLVATGGVVAINDSRSSATRIIDGAGSAVFTRDVILKDPRFNVVEFVETITVLRRS
jgi:predicted O-methyltransferase YrrM